MIILYEVNLLSWDGVMQYNANFTKLIYIIIGTCSGGQMVYGCLTSHCRSPGFKSG